MKSFAAALLLTFSILGVVARGQTPTPVGGEFQVNTYTTSSQKYPSVAVDADGSFVVVWFGGPSGISSQRFDAGGVAVGAEFQVNTFTSGLLQYPSVAVDLDSKFVVVWRSFYICSRNCPGPGGRAWWIQGQRFDAAGTAEGSEFQINTHTTADQDSPAVGVDADGNFVVTWQSDISTGTDTSNASILTRRFDQAGVALGDQFQVNTFTAGDQVTPSLAVAADGSLVVTWDSFSSSGTDNFRSIQGQRFDTAGLPVDTQFQVNTYTTHYQQNSDVAIDGDGEFVVVWQSVGSSGTDSDFLSVQGQRFSAAGNAVGNEFQVNTYTTSSQYVPRLAIGPAGDFVVVWIGGGSYGTDSSSVSIQGQLFDAAGNSVGGEFQVNTTTTYLQRAPAVAMGVDGEFVVVWHSFYSGGTDTSSFSIQGQRFRTEITLFADGFESGDTTAWSSSVP